VPSNELRIGVATRANAGARFNLPVAGGKEHRLIRVERAFGRSGGLCPPWPAKAVLANTPVHLEFKSFFQVKTAL
jgi:hypothetical protein